MFSKHSLRKYQKAELNGITYKFESSLLKNDNNVFNKQCPTGVNVIGRVLYLVNIDKKMKDEAYRIAANELQELWIYGLNLLPKKLDNIITTIRNTYEGTKTIDGFKSLRKDKRHKDKWKEKAAMFNKKMLTGFDMLTTDDEYKKVLETRYGVKMGDMEKGLHVDNCKIKTCECPWDTFVKCRNCPRQMFVDDKIDKQWKKWSERKKQEFLTSKKQKEDAETAFLSIDSTGEIASTSIDSTGEEHNDETFFETMGDDEYTVKEVTPVLMKPVPVMILRSPSTNTSQHSLEPKMEFPQVPIRLSRTKFNPNIMRAVTHVQASYKLSSNDTAGACVDFANMALGQRWEKQANFENNEDSSCDEIEESEGCSNDTPVCKKKRRVQKDLTWRFPSRRTRRRWLRQGALLNLRYVAQKIIKRKPGQVVTLGFDDTTKAAGVHLHDVKSTHITINSDEMDRETYTTGFTPNLSHSGVDQATTLRYKLETLAVLAGDGTSVQEIIELIDFWMSDRSADGDVVLENLGIEEEKILKCSAHIILAIDEAIDFVFRDVELKLGRDSLAGDGIGNKAFQCKNSIVTLGLIAIAKCLSPSHAALTYSLYQHYKDWRESKGLSGGNFKGFQSNRFGRTAFLAKLYLEHESALKEYWDTSVDEHSNKLVLALNCYFNNEWFSMGCQVYSVFNKIIIMPLCQVLGVDEYAKVKVKERTWEGVKTFFKEKLLELREIRDGTDEQNSSVDKLVQKCTEKVVEALDRQISKVSFFRQDEKIDDETKAKLKYAPLTNSGCETRMAELDVRTKFCGGSTPINTISDMQNISANKYLLTEEFDDPKNTEELFKWARTSDEAKKANEMEEEFLNKVKMVRLQAVKAKESVKRRRVARSLKLLDICQQHGGPITPQNLDTLINKLTDEQICHEVSYLKATIAKEIKMKRRVTKKDTQKYTYENIPINELKLSIRNVVKPISKSSESSLEDLLSAVL